MKEATAPSAVSVGVSNANRLALEIDKVIQLAKTESKDEDGLKALVLHAITQSQDARIPDGEDVEKFALELLKDRGSLREPRVLASCLLRLLPERELIWLRESPWRRFVVDLIDQQLGGDLYANNAIAQDNMAHAKVPALIDIVRGFEDQFEKDLSSLTSLEVLNKHRQDLMRILNDKVGKVLAQPFLPVDSTARLTELYKRVEVYSKNRDSLEILASYDALSEEAAYFSKIMRDYGTIYSSELSQRIGSQIERLAIEDFAANKAAQPTRLSIKHLDKKYPLHLVDQTMDVCFELINEGPGFAFDARIEIAQSNGLSVESDVVHIGRMPPGDSRRIEIASTIKEPLSDARFLLTVSWLDLNKHEESEDFEHTITAQRDDIDWDQQARKAPYSLEPVSNEQDLVGRREVLDRLIATINAKQAGSSIIHGQKRVGKTSIARALESHMQQDGWLVVYLEGGDYVEPSAKATVARLGQRLAKSIKRQDRRLNGLSVPEFDEALSPLTDCLDDFHVLLPDTRVLIILDEFDELPVELYERGRFGDPLFLTLRSLSSRPFVGFVLVGGEKMRNILESQGEKLNKWNVVQVDYFSRETNWSDYRELVQRPVLETLDYNEESLLALHDATAGNPYFTKLVCQNVFRMAVNRNDCYITPAEIAAAIEASVAEVKINTFQHFWEDGLLESGEGGKEKSVRRRKVLIAVSDTVQQERPASKSRIGNHRLVRDVYSVESELQEFVTREILVVPDSSSEERYDFKVQLFDAWLKTRGVGDIIAEFTDLDAAFRDRQQQEQLKIKSEEIVRVAKDWGLYKGQPITEDKIRRWLDQFQTPAEQRAMFSIVSKLNYYSNVFVRKKLQEIYDILIRGKVQLTYRLDELKRNEILVSYLDNPSKSGARFARLFADENKIYVKNVVEKGKLSEALEQEEIKALVFIDDFVGTGESACGYLKELDKNIANIVERRSIKVFFVAVVAFKDGWAAVEDFQKQLSLAVECRSCVILDETDQCFSSKSKYFPDEDSRSSAKEIAFRNGKELEKKWPIGYGDLALAVVFEESVPNNSLPILWAESAGWMALFKRH